MDKKPSCSNHKEETNLEENTLSETGECNEGLDLPRDVFLLSCSSFTVLLSPHIQRGERSNI